MRVLKEERQSGESEDVNWWNVVKELEGGERLTYMWGCALKTGVQRAGIVYEYTDVPKLTRKQLRESLHMMVLKINPLSKAKPSVVRYRRQEARIGISTRNLAEWPVDCVLVPAGRYGPLSAERSARIDFDDPNHIYYVDKIPCPFSVTGVVKAMTYPFYAQRASKHNRALAREWKAYGKSTGVKGTIMHAMLEMYVNTGYASVDPLVAVELEYFRRFVREVMQPRDWRVVATEPLVFTDRTADWDSTAGSVDLVLERPDGQLVIVDYKCYAKIHERGYEKIHPTFRHMFAPDTTDSTVTKCSMQISIYASIIEHYYGRSVAEMYTLVLNEVHDSYILLPCDDLKSTMFALLTTHYADVSQRYFENKAVEDADDIWMHEPDTPEVATTGV